MSEVISSEVGSGRKDFMSKRKAHPSTDLEGPTSSPNAYLTCMFAAGPCSLIITQCTRPLDVWHLYGCPCIYSVQLCFHLVVSNASQVVQSRLDPSKKNNEVLAPPWQRRHSAYRPLSARLLQHHCDRRARFFILAFPEHPRSRARFGLRQSAPCRRYLSSSANTL
jgi:hypothetical protein